MIQRKSSKYTLRINKGHETTGKNSEDNQDSIEESAKEQHDAFNGAWQFTQVDHRTVVLVDPVYTLEK